MVRLSPTGPEDELINSFIGSGSQEMPTRLFCDIRKVLDGRMDRMYPLS
jgi:hypothetical protein